MESPMPWSDTSISEQRREFVSLASQEGANVSLLCARFGISRPTGYKWLNRGLRAGENFADRSRRPLHHPTRTASWIEERVVKLHKDRKVWGARKIAWDLERCEGIRLAPSTVHAILKRHGRIGPDTPDPHRFTRFEMSGCNQMWQMDFKGYVTLTSGAVCHPLTVLDDHARFAVGLAACAEQTGETVKARLQQVFRRYGLPEAFYMDNGAPWGNGYRDRWTRFDVWLMKLGIRVIHGRPYHPQGRGKIERFHRTLKREVFSVSPFTTLAQVQSRFDQWRAVYNMDRPHEALDMQVPASRYQPSPRAMPDTLPEVEYDSDEITRKVDRTNAHISVNGRKWKLPKAFRGETVALRPRQPDGLLAVCFGANQIATIDLNDNPEDTLQTVNHVPERL